MDVTAGVPQGSILGPTLWNLIYDGVLRLEWMEGVTVVGFADDLAISARANTEYELVDAVEDTLELINEWMEEKGLQLEPTKTEAVMLRGPRRKNETSFNQGGTIIRPKRAVKYLGVWVDDVGTFGHHVIRTIEKVDGRIRKMAGLLPNIGGPSAKKRKILNTVITSTILYGAPVWYSVMRIQRYRAMLQRAQRKALIRLVSAYRTVSTVALQVIAGEVPIHLAVEERKRLADRADRKEGKAKKEERGVSIARWQEEWRQNEVGGQWTKTLIGNVEEWVKCGHKNVTYYLCQVLSGHGSFRSYTKRIQKDETDQCRYCGESDTPQHTIFVCNRWGEVRRRLEEEVGEHINAGNIVRIMLAGEAGWKSVERYAGEVMRTKEEEERRSQRGERLEEL